MEPGVIPVGMTLPNNKLKELGLESKVLALLVVPHLSLFLASYLVPSSTTRNL